MSTYDYSNLDISSLNDYLASRFPNSFGSTGSRSIGSGPGPGLSAGSRPRFGPGSHRPLFDSSLWGSLNSGQQSGTHGITEPNNNLITNDLDTDPASPRVLTYVEPRVVNILFLQNQNCTEHQTEQYESEDLIVRRGQPFIITLQLDKPYNPQTDSIKLQFATGEKPQASLGTLVRVGPGEPLDHGYWGWKFQDQSRQDNSTTSLTLKVTSAADSVVGYYKLFVDTTRTDEDGKLHLHRYKHPDQFIMLFNPWCKYDQVYMEYSQWREEYVLNETGRIFIGTYDKISAKPWIFGQFDKVCLDASLYLLEKSYLSQNAHANPTLVVRALSAMTNSYDNDNGILVGNWTGQYVGGTAPTAWNGSVGIIEQYMMTRRPVKFGQCWVFSGLLTTLCRSLGIPARSVTNFVSAHDRDFSMTIDTHFNTDGQPLDFLNDSVWNFHVWNEAWFRRPDLPDGNDGWQVVDATPQEASEGTMRCGPAPVAAIKEGNVFLGYDARFIFAEVNGDMITWVTAPSGDLTFAGGDVTHVGKNISTKDPGTNLCLNITENYKYPEGSDAERRSVKRASQHSSKKSFLAPLYDTKRDVTFEWKSDFKPNGDVSFTLHMTNTSNEPRHLDVKVNALATYYTGVTGEKLNSFAKDGLMLNAGQDDTLQWSMSAKDFFNFLDEDATVGSYILAKVKETEQIFTSHEVLVIDKPDLELEVAGGNQVKVGHPVDLTISFTNPLAVPLTSTVIRLEGPGVQRVMALPIGGSLQPGKTLTKSVTLTPRLPGKRELIANLNAQQLTGITGVIGLEVLP